MTNWTRAHDAWIAEKCEGRKILGPGVMYHDERGGEAGWHEEIPIPYYLTDPAAAIRAAEAWAAKDSEFRTWTLHRAGTLLGQCTDDGYHYIHEGEDGLCWVLYNATGGPA